MDIPTSLRLKSFCAAAFLALAFWFIGNISFSVLDSIFGYAEREFVLKLIFVWLTVVGMLLLFIAMKWVRYIHVTPPYELGAMLHRLEILRDRVLASSDHEATINCDELIAGLTAIIECGEDNLPHLKLVTTTSKWVFAQKLAWWAYQTTEKEWDIKIR